ncbi:MAG TPA: hypothetical protein VHZ54_18565 [Solirubrobacterales bacterium]|nr:hypothetical protein [Solirubrobacterales bacterium]
MGIGQRWISRFERLSKQVVLAPLTLRLFALLFVLAELISLVISPSPLRGGGLILAVVAALGIMAAIWVVWFGVGVIAVISVAVNAISGGPWYEIAWAVISLSLLCWPSSWAYVNSRESVEGSSSAEKQQVD